ncbi:MULTISPECIES: helix-turn-helix domain-containing protein [Sphingomonas]|jgi:transcriptional regulator with XRE-family HTH domain|uniref:helix-turn-helix domain-containing protein n=1 Tax=Sphingomonas TaxID=13687 RepID=UPI001AE95678
MTRLLDNPPNRIRELRTAKRITLKAVAEALGTSQTQISRFEVGERPVTIDWLRRIAHALGTDAGDLLNSEDNRMAVRNEAERAVIEIMREGGTAASETVAELAAIVLRRMGVSRASPLE